MVTLGISIFGNYYTSIMKNFNSKTVHVLLKTLFYLFDSAKWLNEKGDYSYFLMSKSTVSFTIFIHPYTEMYVAIVDILVII